MIYGTCIKKVFFKVHCLRKFSNPCTLLAIGKDVLLKHLLVSNAVTSWSEQGLSLVKNEGVSRPRTTLLGATSKRGRSAVGATRIGLPIGGLIFLVVKK